MQAQFLQKVGQHTKSRLLGKLDLKSIEKCCLDLDLCYQLHKNDFPANNCRVELSISKTISIRDSDAIDSYEFKECIRLRNFALEIVKSKITVDANSQSLLSITVLANKRKNSDNDINDDYTPCSIEYKLTQDSLYLGARYNKLVRTLSQTPFFIKGQRKGDGSVSEVIGDYFTKLTGSPSSNMVSSGREDLDVRCLGRGRPFMLELLNPKNVDFDWNEHQRLFNAKFGDLVHLQYLKAVDKSDSHIIKSGEETKSKYYECEVEFTSEITEDEIVALNRLSLPLTIQQKTPMRVVHRRANLTRDKTIFDFKLTGNRMYLKTSAGMYIKEFIHGDCNRTKPSLRDLIKEYCEKDVYCDITNLDIMNVELEWPPL